MHQASRDGLNGWCKDCVRAYMRGRKPLVNVATARKKCLNCGLIKAAEEFHVHSRVTDGLLNMCKDCSNRQQRQKYRRGSSSGDAAQPS